MTSESLPPNVLLFPGASLPEIPEAPRASFDAFVQHVQQRELLDAADCLGALLELDEERAYHCTLHFVGHFRRDRTRAIGRVMRLRLEAHEGRQDAVLLLLRDSFGLMGSDAADLLQPLQEAARPA